VEILLPLPQHLQQWRVAIVWDLSWRRFDATKSVLNMLWVCDSRWHHVCQKALVFWHPTSSI
jgi:hypothetical protein